LDENKGGAIPIDKELYSKVKDEADKIFKERTSAYKSMWIVKKYKDLGGRYRGKKTSNLSSWRKEKWIQVIPYIEKGQEIECGEGEYGKVCRPLKRINDKTPITIGELQKIYTDKQILSIARRKAKDMYGKRVDWLEGSVDKVRGGSRDKLSIVREKAKKLGATEVKISTRKHKKYDVLYKGEWISYGDNRYQDFLDHKDPKRRANYRRRAGGIRDKEGNLTYKNPYSPNFWSYFTLW
jgi:hypothetical protein